VDEVVEDDVVAVRNQAEHAGHGEGRHPDHQVRHADDAHDSAHHPLLPHEQAGSKERAAAEQVDASSPGRC